nr:immunoglobulin light chain junction region [Macaca mulatta]MOW03931.1 immunoglobulin light chain junction region [Macaca mulatta]MOW60290.1 immunoglobulin light chain junction region [Macaca mulatta]
DYYCQSSDSSLTALF